MVAAAITWSAVSPASSTFTLLVMWTDCRTAGAAERTPRLGIREPGSGARCPGLELQRHPRVALVGGAVGAQPVQRLGEQLVERLEPFGILDDPRYSEIQLVDAIRKATEETPFVILDRQVQAALPGNQGPQRRAGEQRAGAILVGRLDDEVVVELRVADGDVLHAEPGAQPAEDRPAVDREAESFGVHVGRAHARELHERLANRHGVAVERDRPLAVPDLDPGATPAAAVLAAQLFGDAPPDLPATGSEPLP